MTQSEINDAQQRQQEIIDNRQARLESTDYIAAKIAEGASKKSDYSETIQQRAQWRQDINDAQAEIARLEALQAEEPEVGEPENLPSEEQ